MHLDSTALLAAGALYATVMPSLSEVRRASLGSEVAVDVRNGLVVGSALLLGVGAMISVDQKSPKPFYMLGGVALLAALCYEGSLRRQGASVTAEPGPAAARALGRYGI